MKRTFNTTGVCYPDEHYMVDLESRLIQMKAMVDDGRYFTVNRGRQYGKTTTLRALRDYLKQDYVVLFLDFQRMSTASFQDEYIFSRAFTADILRVIKNKRQKVTGLDLQSIAALEKCMEIGQNMNLPQMFGFLSDLCDTADRPIVLILDEVDSAPNNQVFLDFLAQLRAQYLSRREYPAFWSVILAGVYDIKNLKQKIRQNGEHKYNSPWNIAVEFDVDMSFSTEDIAGMLDEYRQDYGYEMDVHAIAQLIYDYTSGYPFLVSRICQLMDEQIPGTEGFDTRQSAWSSQGVAEAVKELLRESNALFDDLVKKLSDFPKLKNMLYRMLFEGKRYAFYSYDYAAAVGKMFGFVKENEGNLAVANRIFETMLYNLFIAEEMAGDVNYEASLQNSNQFVKNGRLDMELVLLKFVEHFTDIYGKCTEAFLEENGRRFFLLYLKPIINGVGNYYVEARTRDMLRTDVVVDYKGEQYVVEMKIWRGGEYNRKGEEQLVGYLEQLRLDKGYLLSFNFNKKKEVGVKKILLQGKEIVEAVV